MILLIDSYDSFTNNLCQLIHQTTNNEVVVIHNDTFDTSEYDRFFNEILPLFDYVVVGPGPGHPANFKDIQIVSELYRRQPRIPILGICLGFQSLCYEFGNEVLRLNDVRHGQIYSMHPLKHCAIFDSLEPFKSVRYHSLYVDINNLTYAIEPLAYCMDGDKKILMAAKHIDLPYFGVQYHPESICSDKGNNLIKNFHLFAQNFNRDKPCKNNPDLIQEFKLTKAVHETQLVKFSDVEYSQTKTYINYKSMKLSTSVIGICDHLRKDGAPFLVLNSASTPGEWSIIGLPDHTTEYITHSVDTDDLAYITQDGKTDTIKLESSIWAFWGKKMREKYIPQSFLQINHSRQIPFYGGYLGIVSYEEGKHILVDKLGSFTKSGKTPDFKMAYIDRFLLKDHITNDWLVVSIRDNDNLWVESFGEKIKSISDIDLNEVPKSVQQLDQEVPILFELPSKNIYEKQFEKCQEFLHSGDSYELCLTTSSKIKLSANIDSWDIYKVLTLHKNPSPYSCYMEFDDMTLISSSPERFLSWKDDMEGNKIVQLRPIKGTVKKSPEMTYEMASKILKSPKEVGENLMIVDLIRHDLHQFVPNVDVKQLMSVEEYSTVYQLVSVIEGTITEDNSYHGLDILTDSLPPGSMTGAPKKRSVELLQDIESLQNTAVKGGRRGVYSGVVGYWSITDKSDWSVIIRSAFHYDDDLENSESCKLWRIGAGGAITVLSELNGEWDEMHVKLTSALQAFQ